jgi:hypothetical protein
MSKIYKVYNQEWHWIDEILSVVFIARDSLRRDVKIAVPGVREGKFMSELLPSRCHRSE